MTMCSVSQTLAICAGVSCQWNSVANEAYVWATLLGGLYGEDGNVECVLDPETSASSEVDEGKPFPQTWVRTRCGVFRPNVECRWWELFPSPKEAVRVLWGLNSVVTRLSDLGYGETGDRCQYSSLQAFVLPIDPIHDTNRHSTASWSPTSSTELQRAFDPAPPPGGRQRRR